ncbi:MULTISPECIES: hypothetical protein [Streptomyces]|uniref:Uncharacterized protein n=2 Tax=Streptomyces rimosus subsp. rimosus TaxID=132474 RepID=L8EMI1_STRR1|nr:MULTISPECIES: hypothetical protein [Streptomyces]KOG84139.1 hypothetical protein ADK78_00615 [Kitasatospora aureofaciens]MYT41177.1 hypothetical protein [Streptomyces sp. SID5471]KOT27968.1 hypothetical protein ADK84_37480 [Streptomyces sp. NRRL WC-3701]KOT42266.1 hypothetical protein ADK42_10245 [Streptomyces rimosus subsp. rimosus]KOT68564.1 hypothetical protein ADK44_00910 [Streptomyces rimosus subsp. rimosus]
MPTPASQLPPDATTLARRIATLEREVRELRAARRLEAATVGAGGVRVTAGGRLAMDTPPGVRVVDVGAIRDERFNHSDGTPQQAIWMRREDGTDVFTCFGGIGDATQAWAFWDRQDNPVIADDTVSGSGLARPYLPVPMAPAYQGGWDYWPRTSSTAAQELWIGRIYKQQPRLVVVIRAAMDTSGATGVVDLIVGNNVANSFPVAFAADWFTFGPVDLTGYAHMQQVDIRVRGRRVSGTGTLRASLISAYTLQS